MRRLALAIWLSLIPVSARAGLDGIGAASGDVKGLGANPAAAIGASGIELYGADTATLALLHYGRADNGTTSYPANNTSVFGQSPYAAVRSDLRARGDNNPPRLGLGLSLAAPSGSSVNWPSEGPGRYHMIDGTSYALYLAPVIATRPIERLRFGFGPILVGSRISVKKRVDLAPSLARLSPGNPPPAYESGALEGNFTVDSYGVGLSWTIGVIWDATDELKFGISYLAPADVTDHGKSHLTPSLDLNVTADGNFSIHKHYPPYINGGARWRPGGGVTLSLEAQWIGASRNKKAQVTITGSQIRGTNSDLNLLLTELGLTNSQLINGILDRDSTSINGDKDTGNAIAGAEMRLGKFRTRAEAGFFHASVPPANMTPGNLDFDAVVLGAAGTWVATRRFEIGLSFHEYLLITRNVKNSVYRSDSPDPDLSVPSGNGIYSGSLTRVIASSLLRF